MLRSVFVSAYLCKDALVPKLQDLQVLFGVQNACTGACSMLTMHSAARQALNIPTKINRGTVEIVSDVALISKGEKVGGSEATLLAKLGIKPFSYGLVVQQARAQPCLAAVKAVAPCFNQGDAKGALRLGCRQAGAQKPGNYQRHTLHPRQWGHQ